MSRYRLDTFFLVLPTGSELCPRAGVLESKRNNDQESPFFPFTEGPTGPRANLRQESGRSSRDITGLRELVQVGLLLPRLPESVPGPLRFAPSLRKQAALDGIFSRFFFSSSSIQTVYMGLNTGVYFTSTTAGRNDWRSFSPGSTIHLSRAHFAAPPKRHYSVAPYSRMYSRLSSSNAAALTRH